MQSLDPRQAAEIQAQMNEMTQEQREEYLQFMSERHKVNNPHLQYMQQYTSLRKKMRDEDNDSDDGEASFDAQALHEI